MARKRIGELLVERGAISRQQLEAGLTAQKQTRQRLGLTLIQQGLISETQLAQALAESLGLPTVDLVRVQVDWSAVHMLRARFCEQHELFPFAIEGKGSPQKRLVVALSDPLNDVALQEIEFSTGLKVAGCVATHSQIREAVLRYYHKVAGDPARAPGLPGKGGSVRLVPAGDEPPEPVIMGEEIISGSHPVASKDPALEQLMTERQAKAGGKRRSISAAVSKDLEFLFGAGGDDEAVEKLEKKFWALMRLMARKGLISREEFKEELDEGE